jgi:TRAP-type C4-dicarboxylate transport system substrate-binding protein
MSGDTSLHEAPAAFAADEFSVAEAVRRSRVAREWLAGGYVGIEPLPIAYSGPPFLMRVTAHPPESASVVRTVFKPAFAVLERMSGGRIRVQDRWGGTVHADRDGVLALQDGRSDFAPCYSAWDSESYPTAQALRLPGLFATAEIGTAVSERLYPKYFREDVARKGFCIGRMKATSEYHLFSLHPIRTLDDLQGLRIACGGGIEAEVIRALGAETVSLTSSEKKGALTAQEVDALHLSDGPAEVFGIGRVARFRTALGLVRNNTEFGMSRDFWTRLPADLQRVLHAWLRAEAQAEAQVFYGLAGASAREAFRAAGMEFLYFAPDEYAKIKARADTVVDVFVTRQEAQGRPGAAMLAELKSAAEDLSRKTADDLMTAAIISPVRWEP